MITSRHGRRDGPRARRMLLAILLGATLVLVVGGAGWSMFALATPDGPGRPTAGLRAASPAPAIGTGTGVPSTSVSGAGPSASPSSVPPTGPVAPVGGAVPGRLLMGIGDEADRAAQTGLAKQSTVKMLTSWYNRQSDFGEFMDSWRTSLVPRLYRAGYAMHVVQWTPMTTRRRAAASPWSSTSRTSCRRPTSRASRR